MSHLFLFHLLFSMLVIPPQARKAEAPIASIQSLNRHAEAVNSHAGETSRSTLETDWRSSVILTGKELGLDYLEYPRLKILPDGSYLLFYQTRDQEVNKDHDGVLSAFSPDGRNWEPYAIQLPGGEISLGTQSAGMKAKNYPGEGYVAEIAIPKDRLPLAKGIFFNAVLAKGEMTDGFNFRPLDKVDNWFKIKL